MPSRIDMLNEMLLKEPEDSFLNYAMALEFAKLNEIGKSISLLEKITVRDENYLAAYYQLGKFYEQAGQKEKALATYQKGMSVAKTQKDQKTFSELNEAMQQLEE